jgi:hypothetical protein
MLAAHLDRTPLQSNSIDTDLALGGYLSLMNKPRHCILFSCPSYAILDGRATKLSSLAEAQLRARDLVRA